MRPWDQVGASDTQPPWWIGHPMGTATVNITCGDSVVMIRRLFGLYDYDGDGWVRVRGVTAADVTPSTSRPPTWHQHAAVPAERSGCPRGHLKQGWCSFLVELASLGGLGLHR